MRNDSFRDEVTPVTPVRCLDEQRSHILAQSITQRFRYLVSHEIGYGIISSIDLSYLISCVDVSLRIFEGIDWHHPRFIAALAYFMEMTAKDTTAYHLIWVYLLLHSMPRLV